MNADFSVFIRDLFSIDGSTSPIIYVNQLPISAVRVSPNLNCTRRASFIGIARVGKANSMQ